MARLKQIELGDGTLIPVLYEDRLVIALDKPAGWMLAPDSWDRTGRNLQLALVSSINSGDPWARSRRIQFLRFVHRLDADTSGIVLFARNAGSIRALSELFETCQVEKSYLAVVAGVPGKTEWFSAQPIGPDPGYQGRMRIDTRDGKPAETRFEVLQRGDGKALIRALPLTGRTHQIRVHLAASGYPVLGDPIYGSYSNSEGMLGLRAWTLSYPDPFQRRLIRIRAPIAEFCREFGFDHAPLEMVGRTPRLAADETKGNPGKDKDPAG